MQFAHFEFDSEADRLGEGALSEVYRAVDEHLGRTVALKILRAHVEIDPAADQRFHREAKHTSSLQHPNIATIYEYGRDQGTSFIAMEYLEGRTLDKILRDQTLGYEECLRIALQVAAALAHVHKHGLIHRDLKPGNIMVLDDGSIKLLDFGIARASDESSITQHGTLVGTVLYMSPEQVRGDELDLRSDIFSFGSVLYHAMTGALPFPGKSFPEVCMAILDGEARPPSLVRTGFPKPLEDLILTCLSPKPADRFPNADEVYGQLLSLADRRMSRPRSGSQIGGTLVIPPIDCGAGPETHAGQIAGSLRKDLASELGRTKGLTVWLLESGELPSGGGYEYVLQTTLALEPPNGTLDLVLERYVREDGRVTVSERNSDRIRQTEPDEWALQADLVRAAVRTIRRRLSQMVVTPTEDAARNRTRALELTRRAHDVLLKGTSKHLMAAISSFRAAIDADLYCALAYAGLSEALVRKYLYWEGDEAFLTEAREFADRALALDRECAEAHTSLGFANHLSGRLAEAGREYRIAIQQDNTEWLAHRLLGAVMAREGNFKSASGILRRAIALKSTHIGSYDHLYTVLQRLDRYQESLEVADEGISAAAEHLEDESDNQEARLHLALLHARLGSHEKARGQVERAMEVAPKDGYTCFHAACVFAVTGDFTDAIDLLIRARDRGFYIQSELRNNTDLDILRGLPEFRELL